MSFRDPAGEGGAFPITVTGRLYNILYHRCQDFGPNRVLERFWAAVFLGLYSGRSLSRSPFTCAVQVSDVNGAYF